MHHAHGIFDGHKLRATLLVIRFGATEAGQDECALAGYEMPAVELGRYVHGQLAATHGCGGVVCVGRCGEEVAAEANEDACFTGVHGADGLASVVAVCAR